MSAQEPAPLPGTQGGWCQGLGRAGRGSAWKGSENRSSRLRFWREGMVVRFLNEEHPWSGFEM